MEHVMETEIIASILKQRTIKTVFQPIVSLRDGGILGYEALSRVTGEYSYLSAEELFAEAHEHNLLWDIEYLTRSIAIKTASDIIRNNYRVKIFINVSSSIMQDARFNAGFTKNILSSLHIDEENIVFEITEKKAVEDINLFKNLVNHYKGQKFKIAVDDLGSGYSGLNLISDIIPHYAKLDMQLIRNIHKDRLKQGLVKGIVEFSNISNILLIAEGIESQEELEIVCNLGVQYGQGYYIQIPKENVVPTDQIFLHVLRDINIRKNHIYGRTASDIYIGNICTHTHTALPNERIKDLYTLYANNSDFIGLCIVGSGIPVGIITRENLYRAFGSQFGFSPNNNKTISEIMDRDFLAVDEKEPMNVVSGLAMSRAHNKLYDFVVVTNDQRYSGIVTIKDLLIKTTEIDIFAVKHQNPLTGLPGNILIEQELAKCVTGLTRFSVAYIDLDNFKAYNDIYGFESGDRVLKLLSDILKELISEICFIGHTGGDDFIVIVHDHINECYFSDILYKFSQEVLRFYNEDDLKKGYITAMDRNGRIRKFPLLNATCVITGNRCCTYNSTHDLVEKLAQLKKMEKARRSAFS
jgi:EAL domain-containing protein (putative c-di-GMP-specific phosphodiesterase class I)/GGDEF domain-containing protein